MRPPAPLAPAELAQHRAAAAAEQVFPAVPSFWHQPAAAGVTPSVSGFLLVGASALLSLSDTALSLHLHQETKTENAQFTWLYMVR